MASINPNIWLEKNMLQSNAFMSLTNPTAMKVLMLFMSRRQFEKVGSGKRQRWAIKNNGEIEFTYKEAQSRWGISSSSFKRAIAELVNKGFIDIAETGMGVHKVKNLYAISNRWKDYGTPDFESPKQRAKGPINRGFQPGNKFGKNNRKKNLTVSSDIDAVPTTEHIVT